MKLYITEGIDGLPIVHKETPKGYSFYLIQHVTKSQLDNILNGDLTIPLNEIRKYYGVS